MVVDVCGGGGGGSYIICIYCIVNISKVQKKNKESIPRAQMMLLTIVQSLFMLLLCKNNSTCFGCL